MAKKVIGIGVAAVIVVFIVLGIMRSRTTEEVESISEIQKQKGVPVKTLQVQSQDVRETRTFYGDIRAGRQAVVTAKLMERIDTLYVEVGDQVQKGQAVVRFDTTASQAAVKQARLSMENAKRDLERMKALLDKGAISRQQYDQVKLGYDVARENYETALRSVELVAPISGIVSRIEFQSGDQAFPGDVVMEVSGSSQYEVEFEVTGEDRQRLRVGQTVDVVGKTGEAVEGRITKVSLSADPMTRMFKIRARIPVTENVFPGELAQVDVVVAEHDDVVALPADALLHRDGKNYAVVVDEKANAWVREVKLGLQGDSLTEIRYGLKDGDQVAVYGHASLQDGDLVNVIDD
ncbi:efflux RND transporter periplasmic adaptor subunit [bacterium]|nr:efflux RND transporter periplasmic adaptor subunit [bacterium]